MHPAFHLTKAWRRTAHSALFWVVLSIVACGPPLKPGVRSQQHHNREKVWKAEESKQKKGNRFIFVMQQQTGAESPHDQEATDGLQRPLVHRSRFQLHLMAAQRWATTWVPDGNARDQTAVPDAVRSEDRHDR